MSYQGMERRRNQMYVTRNTEYFLRDGVCVAVRNRRTGKFAEGHIALTMPVAFAVRLSPNGAAPTHLLKPAVGDSVCFCRDVGSSQQIVTSRIESIERPPKELVARYS